MLPVWWNGRDAILRLYLECTQTVAAVGSPPTAGTPPGLSLLADWNRVELVRIA